MANEEQVKMLTQGIEVWKEWRLNHLSELIDLSEADLRGTNFREAYLRGADLRGAYLSEADLRGANLSGANLSGVDLSGADLSGADLSEADLSGAGLVEADLNGANLSEADLSEADLSEADLSGANLSEADLSEALLGTTVFGNVDLREVKGLENVVHWAPSTIGIDTIYRSQGEIPEVFLRKAGVPETFLTNMRALVDAMRPIDFYSCFISYSSKDQAFAERLYADLQSKGVRCWFAPHDLRIGQRLRRGIDEAIRLYDKLLLVLSSHSVKSDWVEFEVEVALEKEKQRETEVLFPIRLDNDVLASSVEWAAHMRRTRHIGDFEQWKQHDHYQQAFERLLRDLTGSEGKNERK